LDTSQTSTNRNHSVALADRTTPTTDASIALLHQFARDLIAPPELHDILRRALLTAVQLTGAQHATLLLLDEMGEQIRYRVALDNGNLAPLELVAKPMMSKGLAGWVVRARQSALVQDTEQDGRWLPAPGLGDLRSALVTPLICMGQVLGVLTLGSEAPGHFLGEHVPLIEILGTQTASAIKLAPATTADNNHQQSPKLPPDAALVMAPPRAQDTVALAAELRGLSTAAAKLPPEVCFEDVLNMYIQTMFSIVHDYHGMMVHIDGDTLLAAFEANGGGAIAAARAALAMQIRMQQLCADWHQRFGLTIGLLNIGIAHGMALLDRMIPRQATCRVVGAVITQAARLRELARGGEILVADDMHLALNSIDGFELTALPPLHLGAAITQSIYRLVVARHTGE
jgi:class 3 adenylate cyclase